MSTAVDFVRHFRQLRALVIGDAMLDTYSKPSAKAPVIHPGDEAPFLYGVRGRRVRSAG